MVAVHVCSQKLRQEDYDFLASLDYFKEEEKKKKQ